LFSFTTYQIVLKINSLLQTDNFAANMLSGFVINFQFMEISAQKFARELQK